MRTRLEPLLKKACLQISLLRGKSGIEIPLSKLLAQMDAYKWDSVKDTPVSEDERRKRLSYLRQVIYASGIEFNGSILDLASSVTSLAYLYPDVVAVDNDPRKIKMLRKDGKRGIVADMERLPFEERSFDYVVSISPPQKPIILRKNGYVRFDIDQEYNKKVVDAMLRIARQKVLISSYYIFLQPPFEYLIEKKDTVNGFYTAYYVIYRANNAKE